MENFDSSHVKNIVLLGHSGSGKTTLAETMIFEAGLLPKRGNIEEKNTLSDYTVLEQEKGSSIFSTLLHTKWRGYKINLIDTPGNDDYCGEIIAPLRVADTAILVLNASTGVESGTEIIWEYVLQYKTPTIIAINQTDHELSDFDNTVEQAKNRFGKKVLVVQYPLNQRNGFNSIVDVLNMVMYVFPSEGGKPVKQSIPESEIEKASALHNQLIETIAEHDDTLMSLYFEKGTLDEDEMKKGLKSSMIHQEIVPIFVVSAKKNMGAGRIMGFIDNICPSANEGPVPIAISGQEIPCDPFEPACIFVFKTVSEPHLGEMSFFKVYSGTIKQGDELINAATGNTEKLSQLYVTEGKKREQVQQLSAGDIGATIKLKNTHTNNTLHVKGETLEIPPIQFPESRIRMAIVPERKGEEEKLATALHILHEEDPTLSYGYSRESKQTLIYGQGEMHINVIKWKLENIHKVPVTFLPPRISYRETIRKSVESSYRHKKQSGGSGQFGEVSIRIEPFSENMPDPQGLTVRGREEIQLPWGGKLVFLNCIVGGAIENRFIPSVLKGIMEKMENGPLTGSYVRDIRVCLFDGKMHAVDSNDLSFKIAGMMAFKEGFEQADPRILEPIYEIDILTPENNTGLVMSELQSNRSVIEGMDTEGHFQRIKARIPLSETNSFASSLRSLTQGKSKYALRFLDFFPVSGELQAKLIAEHEQLSIEK